MTDLTAVKKRIMFSKGDDLYFISYNVLLILHSLDCTCGVRVFKDFRKLAFLMDFVSNRNLTKILAQGGPDRLLNAVDRDLFTRAYADGMLRLNHLYRLLYTLEKKGLITLERERESGVINVCLNKDALSESFFDKNIFKAELENIQLIKKNVQRTTVLSLEKLLQALFDNHGIKRWVKY